MMEIGVPSIGFSPRPKKTARYISWWLSETKENGDCFERIERWQDQEACSRLREDEESRE
ncbi:hypothetical protein DY000_02037153 [Brassica cretica]|uniref:Uncharacterized protein n=1 Tax=Brassica cretica TaxID=69181 RepID=A0ABQ7B6M2_BRACR|nr:hypothetical protein DY000_02037153 [Brassica cretica]